MAQPGKKLTDRAARGALNEGWHLDGDGLYLVVARTGARSWIYRFRHQGGRREIGLGSLLEVSLADARIARDAAKVIAAAGGDPAARRRNPPSPGAAKSEVETDPVSPPSVPAAPTLRECWVDYVAAQEGGWRGRKTKEGWMRSIDSHAAAIKDKPVDQIDRDDVLGVVQPIWLTKAESAGKLRAGCRTSDRWPRSASAIVRRSSPWARMDRD